MHISNKNLELIITQTRVLLHSITYSVLFIINSDTLCMYRYDCRMTIVIEV